MDRELHIVIGLIMLLLATIGFLVGQATIILNQDLTASIYRDKIKPALQDCTHPDYYYQDSHRELCDGLGVNATK